MTRLGTCAAALGLTLAAACSEPAPSAPVGVGPASNPPSSAAARPKLDLAQPDPATPAPAPTAPAPAVEPTPTAASGVIGPDIADLGPFDVISWEEAKARAEKQIQPANADQELEKLRMELENRP